MLLVALKIVEEVQQGNAGDWRWIRRRGRLMEWRAQSRRVTLTTCMDDVRHAHNLRPTMWCANHDDGNLTTGLCAHGITRASIHVLRFMCAMWRRCSGSWWSRCHWCRASCRSVSPRIYAIPSVEFFPAGFCSPIVALVVRLYSVIVNSSVAKLLHTFCTAKTGHLRCCLYRNSEEPLERLTFPSVTVDRRQL